MTMPLLCTYALYVCSVCMLCMYALYVCSVCMICTYALYVCSVCMLCIYALYVCSVYMLCMHDMYVCSVNLMLKRLGHEEKRGPISRATHKQVALAIPRGFSQSILPLTNDLMLLRLVSEIIYHLLSYHCHQLMIYYPSLICDVM